MSTKIDETDFNRAHCRLVRQRHDGLVAAGVNPDLAAVSREVLRLDSLRMSEYQVAEYLNGAPLDAGRRGLTGKSLQADAATQRAARLSKTAEDSDGDCDLHEDAAQAHRDARSQHLAVANYHLQQIRYHRNQANPAGLEGSNASDNAPGKCHCASCNCDFDEADGKLDDANRYTCPECGAYLNKEAAEMENDETTKQEQGTTQPATAKPPNRYDAINILKCPSCKADYTLLPGEQFSDIVTCPCGERINVSSARREQFDEDGKRINADETKPVETKRTEPQAMHLIECARALSNLGDSVPELVMYMPAGTFSICPSTRDGKPCPVTIRVDKQTADRIEQQRKILAAGGNKPFFSIEHGSDLAAFWPTRFFFAARPDATGRIVEGVWVEGEWSQAGRDAVAGKNYRTFSPTFWTDELSNDPDNPAEVVCNPGAPLNFGALVNDPAFGSAMSPLWPDAQSQVRA